MQYFRAKYIDTQIKCNVREMSVRSEGTLESGGNEAYINYCAFV